MGTKRHSWRRRSPTASMALAVVDHDTARFTLEGVIDADEPWVVEVYRARCAGRKIEISLFDKTRSEEIANTYRLKGYVEWPRKSILMI